MNDQIIQRPFIMLVSSGDPNGQWCAPLIYQDMDFAARFGSVGGIGSGIAPAKRRSARTTVHRLPFPEDMAFAAIETQHRTEDRLPNPLLPPGFVIRPMGGEAEIEAYVALHRAAFGADNMTIEYRRTIMSAPDYLPELDLVAVAPNGDLAAFCVCQVFPDDAPRAGGQKEGWTDPLGTHPTYQRRGLAKALILTGMRLLKARGLDTALLGTSSKSVAMQRAAAAVGFCAASNTLWYSGARHF